MGPRGPGGLLFGFSDLASRRAEIGEEVKETKEDLPSPPCSSSDGGDLTRRI